MMETEMVALLDDPLPDMVGVNVSILALLDLSEVFNTCDHGLFLHQLWGLGVGEL